jgi:hypothetical protein
MLLIGAPTEKKVNPQNVVDGQRPVCDRAGIAHRRDELGQLCPIE